MRIRNETNETRTTEDSSLASTEAASTYGRSPQPVAEDECTVPRLWGPCSLNRMPSLRQHPFRQDTSEEVTAG